MVRKRKTVRRVRRKTARKTVRHTKKKISKKASLRQTPMRRTAKGLKQDRKLRAKKPGRRVTRSGSVYYERRPNRSDRHKYL